MRFFRRECIPLNVFVNNIISITSTKLFESEAVNVGSIQTTFVPLRDIPEQGENVPLMNLNKST